MRNIIPLLLIWALASCNKSNLNGRIEEKESSLFLVNTSTDKAYQFTVKLTQYRNDSISDYKTDMIRLAPGETHYLGEKIETKFDFSLGKVRIPVKKDKIYFNEDGLPVLINLPKGATLIKPKFDPNKSAIPINKKIDLTGFDSVVNNYYDTLINGEKYILVEKEDTISKREITLKFEYEVTGQLEIKNDIKYTSEKK